MDWGRVKTNWEAHAASARQRWPMLTEKELVAINGDRDKLIIHLQDLDAYGKARAEFEVETWRQELDDVATLVAGNNGPENFDAPVRD